MSYTSPNFWGWTNHIVGVHSFDSMGDYLKAVSQAGAISAWPTANKAIYIPLALQQPTTVYQLGIVNGGTASGNFDVGILDAAGNKLVSSGSTAQSGTSASGIMQLVNVTDTSLGRGLYYLALAFDNITATAHNWAPTALRASTWGIKEETTAFTLPATATFANITSAYIPDIFAVCHGGTV